VPVAQVSELPVRSRSREGIAGGPFSSGSIGSVSGVRSLAAGILPLGSYSFIEVLVRSYRPLNVMAEEYFYQFRSLTARKLLVVGA
jgi:hypothetical protein